MKTLKLLLSVILGLGCFLVLNENFEALYLNLIGIACAALLVYINRNNTAVE